MDSVNVPWFFTMGVSSFGNPRIEAYLQLPAAYRSLSRPSSAPDAKAFTLCSCSLELPSCQIFVRIFAELIRQDQFCSRSYLNCLSFFKNMDFFIAAKRCFLLALFASPCWFLSWQNCFYPLIGKTWSLVLFRNRDSSLSSLSVFSYSIYALFDFQWSWTLCLSSIENCTFSHSKI